MNTIKMPFIKVSLLLMGQLLPLHLVAAPMVLVGDGGSATNGGVYSDTGVGALTTAFSGLGSDAEVGLYADQAGVGGNFLTLNKTDGLKVETDNFLLSNNAGSTLFQVDSAGETQINSDSRSGGVTIGNVVGGNVELITGADSRVLISDTETSVLNQNTVTVTGLTTNINAENSRARTTNIGNGVTGTTTNINGATNIVGTTTVSGVTSIDGSSVNINTGAAGGAGGSVTVGSSSATAGGVTLQSGTNKLMVDSTGTTVSGTLLVDKLSFANTAAGEIKMAIGDITVGEKERGFIATGAETILSGGTTTSASHLTLNSQGADFTNRETGVASRVTGIADGMSPLDAVNRRQLDMTYGGIASVAALAALPSPAPNRHFSIGMGTSYYEGQTGVALGMKGSLTDTTQFSLGTSWNSSASTPLVNGGVSMSW